VNNDCFTSKTIKHSSPEAIAVDADADAHGYQNKQNVVNKHPGNSLAKLSFSTVVSTGKQQAPNYFDEADLVAL
jgi:type IV secretory pathway VirB10-like protein